MTPKKKGAGMKVRNGKNGDGPGMSYTKTCELWEKKVLQDKSKILRTAPVMEASLKKKREKARKNYKKLSTEEKKKINTKRRENAEKLQNWRHAHDMNAQGFIYNNVKVMVTEPSLTNNHPYFHGVPHFKLKKLPQHLIDDIQQAETLLFDENLYLEAQGRCRRRSRSRNHRFGGNTGVNFGIRVLNGGGYACKEFGRSGVIHPSPLLDKNDELISRDELWKLVKDVLDEMYGKEAWYKRVVHIAAKLNEEARAERCIPGTPVSGIWITTTAKENAVHIDTNVVGPTFVFSVWMDDHNPVYLNVCSPDGRHNKKARLNGKVAAGLWASFPHCNIGTNENNVLRHSWTCYMDQHVFSLLYRDLYKSKLLCRNCGHHACTFTDAQYIDGMKQQIKYLSSKQ